MSSELQSALSDLQLNDYGTVAVLTAVGYDYVLTFSSEIEYIWTKPWTLVSILFIVVRYVGLLSLVIACLEGSSFLPLTEKSYVFLLSSSLAAPEGQIVGIVNGWAYMLFFVAADLVMILRIWAMYNQSKLIIRILLTFFFVETITFILAVAIDRTAKSSPSVIQILDFSICIVQPNSLIWQYAVCALQIIHGAVICTLAIVQFVKQSFQMYRTTNQWQPNQYISLLMRQGIFYFLIVFMFTLIDVLAASGKFPLTGWQVELCFFLDYVPMYTATPRFIINIRELYEQGTQKSGIDTGFGLSSGHGAGGTAIMFADVEQIGESECIEEVPREVGVTWQELK